MRILPLIAASAFAVASVASVQAGEGRSLSLVGVDGKIPSALGKAAETPKIVEAPKPPEPPKPPDPPKTVEAPPPPPPPPAPPAQAETPAYAPRPAIIGTKPGGSKDGQVTFDEKSASPPPTTTAPTTTTAAPPAATSTEKPKTARSEKSRRNRGYWSEARIMREIHRYSGYAGMIGGW